MSDTRKPFSIGFFKKKKKDKKLPFDFVGLPLDIQKCVLRPLLADGLNPFLVEDVKTFLNFSLTCRTFNLLGAAIWNSYEGIGKYYALVNNPSEYLYVSVEQPPCALNPQYSGAAWEPKHNLKLIQKQIAGKRMKKSNGLEQTDIIIENPITYSVFADRNKAIEWQASHKQVKTENHEFEEYHRKYKLMPGLYTVYCHKKTVENHSGATPPDCLFFTRVSYFTDLQKKVGNELQPQISQVNFSQAAYKKTGCPIPSYKKP